jgi:hypothetical protein
LGLKSPFIEFNTEFEVLSNSSIHLNLTQDRSKLPFLKNADNLDSFINSIDPHNKIYDKQPNISHVTSSTTFETLLERDFREKDELQFAKNKGQPLSDSKSFIDKLDNRKYIIPLALKTTSYEKEKKSSIYHGSSTNINDLKEHILMLQNLTINDKSFRSKFVVFPSLKRQEHSPISTSMPQIELFHNASSLTMTVTTNSTRTTPTKLSSQYMTSKIKISNIKPSEEISSLRGEKVRNSSKEYYTTEKITVIPQVLLQNDQTSWDNKNRDNMKKKKRKMTSVTAETHYTVKYIKKTIKTTKSMLTKSVLKIDERTTESNKGSKNVQISRNNSEIQYKREHPLITKKNQRKNRNIFFSIQNTTEIVEDDVIHKQSASRYINQNRLNWSENTDLDTENCNKVRGFSEEQRKLCLVNVETMPALSRGARSAIQVRIFNLLLQSTGF